MKNYILKTVNADMTSYGGFKWKTKGIVKCEDWKPTKKCGNGLHGALNGVGNGRLFDWSIDVMWIVAEVDKKKGVDLGGKWKFPSCKVVFTGGRKEATDYLLKKVGKDTPMIGCFKQGGDRSVVIGGDYATVQGGNWAKVSGGDRATVIGGNKATVSGGDYSRVSGGNEARVSGGNEAKVSGGDGAKVSGGDGARVSGGDGARVSGGDGAKVSGGDKAILSVKYWDWNKYRVAIAYVGEDGIKANTWYKVNKFGKFYEVKGE